MKTRNFICYAVGTLMVLCLACTKSDDGNEAQTTLSQKFTGIWKPIEMSTFCTSGGTDIENFTTCEQTGRLTVNADGTWNETYYYEYISGMCEGDGISSGTWKIVNNKLFVTEENFAESEITFFKVDATHLLVGQYDNDICGENDISSYYYRKYIKI